IELMCLRLTCGPIEHHVRGGNVLDAMRAWIDRVATRIERLDPNTPLPLADQIAVLEGIASHVLAGLADKRDYHPRVRNGDLRDLHRFNGGETGVDKITAGEQHLFL